MQGSRFDVGALLLAGLLFARLPPSHSRHARIFCVVFWSEIPETVFSHGVRGRIKCAFWGEVVKSLAVSCILLFSGTLSCSLARLCIDSLPPCTCLGSLFVFCL